MIENELYLLRFPSMLLRTPSLEVAGSTLEVANSIVIARPSRGTPLYCFIAVIKISLEILFFSRPKKFVKSQRDKV